MQTAQRLYVRWWQHRDYDYIDDNAYEECAALMESGCKGLVVESRGQQLGYLIYEPLKQAVRIRRLYVHERFRRLGVGTLLVDYLRQKLSAHLRTQLVCDVDDGDLGAHLFFRSCGFVASVCGECNEFYRFRWPA